MGSPGLPKRVSKSCFLKEAIRAKLSGVRPRANVKNRRAEFPPTDDASLHKDSGRKASEVLKRGLKALAGDQKLGTFVDHVLAVLTEQLGGLASSLWLLDGAKRHFCLHSICEGGRVVAAEESGHPFAQRPYRIPKASPTWSAIQAKRPFVQYDPASDTSYFPPVQRELFVKLGVRALVWLPLVFGDALIGVLAVRMSEERAVNDEELEPLML